MHPAEAAEDAADAGVRARAQGGSSMQAAALQQNVAEVTGVLTQEDPAAAEGGRRRSVSAECIQAAVRRRG